MRDRLEALLAERILVLDGAYGTAIQARTLADGDYRGERFADHPRDVKGDPDLLNLTRPDVVEDIHRSYLAAGADIVTTNTFTATAIAQADYGLEEAVVDLNRAGAEIARRAADAFGPDRFVAGSVGPTNQTLSLSPRVNEPAYRTVTFDRMAEAYAEQIRALVDGGADLLLIETIFDTLNAKAAIAAASDVAPDVPLMISVTITDRSGRTLSGQTIDAFWLSIAHAEPFTVGVNCALGAAEMRPYLESLARIAPVYTTCHPNAGLPNAFGGYDERPETTSKYLREFAESGLANVLGGCCGTTDEHVRAIAAAVAGLPPRKVPAPRERDRAQRARAVLDHAGHRLRDGRRTPERHGVGAVPQDDRGGRLPGRRRDRGRPGPQRREHARREHGRRSARRREGHDHVPEPDRHRARDRPRAGDGRLVQVGRPRGGSEMPPGQGHRELDQPEGGRGGLPREGAADQALRGGGRRDGVRRAGAGRHRRAQAADPRAFGRVADRPRRLRARGHRRRPLHPRDRDRDRGAQRLRRRRSSRPRRCSRNGCPA